MDKKKADVLLARLNSGVNLGGGRVITMRKAAII